MVDTATRKVQVSSIARVAEVSSILISKGFRPIIVSSGAVGLGCARLGLLERPTHVAGKQAAAAVGQGKLMSVSPLFAPFFPFFFSPSTFSQRSLTHSHKKIPPRTTLRAQLYDDIFSVLGHVVAQVLLTYDNFGDRMQYTNAKHAFLELLDMGVIPIVNENDTVATQELRVGDNDTLSALVASMVGAQWLLLLTDVEALYNADPRTTPDASIIRTVDARDIYGLRRQMLAGCPKLTPGEPFVEGSGGGGGKGGGETGGAGSAFGTGGMATKLKAAQLATAAGTAVVVMDTGSVSRVCEGLIGGLDGFSSRGLGTTFLPVQDPLPLSNRKRWIVSVPPSGTLILDEGAVAAIEAHKSLFPSGVQGVEGVWEAQDAVALVGAKDGKEVARALVNYSSADCTKMKGLQSAERTGTLGYEGAEAIADRGHIVVL